MEGAGEMDALFLGIGLAFFGLARLLVELFARL
jgi:hypothetical protein